MTTVTLEAIEAQQTTLSKMIEAFKAQAATSLFEIAHQRVELRPGEHYAGIIFGKEGAPSYHVILLPGERESINWSDAGEWAKSIGGELPGRREGHLLIANCKDQFTSNWYWLAEQYASDDSYAWVQGFDDGGQTHYHKDDSFRARAVRRLAIQ